MFLGSASICGVGLPAQAGILDSLFGGSKADAAVPAAGQRLWVVRENSEIRRVPREAGSQPNQHPARISADTLRQRLGQVQFTAAGGTGRALFTPDEAGELAAPLAEALAVAGPDDDLLLVSSARRNDATMYLPVAVTARLFVQSGALQFIVNDARFEFYDKMRGTNRPPEFSYGSRTRPGNANLLDPSATVVRADWLSMPLMAAAATGTIAAPVGMQAAPAAPGAPAMAPVARPRDAGFAEEVEQRLMMLKRLREKGLITEEEHQQKRKEILNSL